MKISTFNPMIVSKNSDEIIALFEELGFEKSHVKSDLNIEGIVSTRMKDASGFHVDVAHSDHISTDISAIRMNVDNFDEACEKLQAKGFKKASGNDKIASSATSKSTLLLSPSGFGICVCEHLK